MCSSFELYRQQPVNFFMQRFSGMTLPVAEFLAHNVFCILDDPKDDSKRISARAFGNWIKDLPTLLGGPSMSGHARTISISSVQGHRLHSIPHSRRPSLRNSVTGEAMSSRASRNLSRAPSLGPAFEDQFESQIMLSSVPDGKIEEESMHGDLIHDHHDNHELDAEVEGESGSRSASTHKRRKRGARKGKGSVSAAVSPTLPSNAHDATLETLAQASQALAREISRTSRQSGAVPMSPAPDVPPLQYPISPGMALPPLSLVNASVPASLPSPSPDTPSISKKPSKWKLSFGKTTSTSGSSKQQPAVEDVPPLPELPNGGKQMGATASNVTNLIMGLNAPTTPPSRTPHSSTYASGHDRDMEDENGSWTRGRRLKASPYAPASPPDSASWGPSSSGSPFRTAHPRTSPERRYASPYGGAIDKRSERGISPSSTRSGRPLASSASSMASSNWRSSMSSAGTSTSGFTRYSNGSTRSVSTAATSVSAQSWRSQNSKHTQDSHGRPVQMPANVKCKYHYRITVRSAFSLSGRFQS